MHDFVRHKLEYMDRWVENVCKFMANPYEPVKYPRESKPNQSPSNSPCKPPPAAQETEQTDTDKEILTAFLGI